MRDKVQDFLGQPVPVDTVYTYMCDETNVSLKMHLNKLCLLEIEEGCSQLRKPTRKGFVP